MKWKRTTPGHRPGAIPRLGATPDTKNHSVESIQESQSSDNPPLTFNGHRFLCFFRQEPVYGKPERPWWRGLYFLRGETLVALTPKDLHELSHSCLPYCFPQLRAAGDARDAAKKPFNAMALAALEKTSE